MQAVAVDETKLEIEDEEVHVWATLDVETFKIPHINISLGWLGLDALLFHKEVLKHYRCQPE